MNDAVRELTLEELIELDYSSDMIRKKLDEKLKERDKKNKSKVQTAARQKAIAVIKEYLETLGVPASVLDTSEFDSSFQSFEKEIEPALKVFSKVPKKDERSVLDESAFETALGALRAFADSL